MSKKIIRNARLVNEGKIVETDVLIVNERIEKIASQIDTYGRSEIFDAKGFYLIPGMIDDQVHFREPGLTHKGTIFTESRAAVAGGITSFMEMPNTIPNAVTRKLLEEKYEIASRNSIANYSFFMGTSNDNLDELMQTDLKNVCGIKIFMGSSTGNMLVDDISILEKIFSQVPHLIATHCEDEETIKANMAEYKERYGHKITIEMHPEIRSAQACILSSSSAIALAKKYNTRLHILHISTEIETNLFENLIPLKNKKITSEACVHHLIFNNDDYDRLGNLIKWNPAIKTEKDQKAILAALLDNRIDVIATDHAPHTLDEKMQSYLLAPSGGPLVQHALPALFQMVLEEKITIEKVVEKTSHALADCFNINDRGYVREGYFADLVLVDMNKPQKVEKSNLLYKCAWSPFEGKTFEAGISKTFVNGNLVYSEDKIQDFSLGKRMSFNN